VALCGIWQEKGKDLLLFESGAGLTQCWFNSAWKRLHHNTAGSRKA